MTPGWLTAATVVGTLPVPAWLTVLAHPARPWDLRPVDEGIPVSIKTTPSSTMTAYAFTYPMGISMTPSATSRMRSSCRAVSQTWARAASSWRTSGATSVPKSSIERMVSA